MKHWGRVLSWRRIGPNLLASASCCSHCSFGCILSICWAHYSLVDFSRIQTAVVDQTSSRPPNSDRDLFLVQVWLWEVLGSFLLVQPLSWFSPVVYRTHFSSHVTIRSRNGVLLHRVKRRQHFKTTCFLRGWVSSWDTHLSSSFTFPACFSCWMTIELLTLSSLAVSHVVTRGCASMILPIVIVKLRWAATALLIFKAHVSLKMEVQNFLNLHCTICLLAVPRWSAFLMLWVVSAALQPILNSN